MRLAGGDIIKKNEIQRGSLNVYFQLLEYVVDKTNRENQKPPA